jgi:hypothetical protein
MREQMYLIDIPLKGCQGRSNPSSIVHAVTQRWAPDTFFGIRSSDTSTPVSDTDTPILFKITESDTRYSDTQKTSFS